MSYADDERHWYGPGGWKRLRSSVGSLGMVLASDLVEDLRRPGRDPQAAARAFVERLVETVGAIVDGAVGENLAGALAAARINRSSGCWRHALSLLGDIDGIAGEIARSADKLVAPEAESPHAPEAILRTAISSALERARRDFEPGSAHRRKVWETIARVSRAVAESRPDGPLANPLSDAHLEAVGARLAVDYPDNHNLPRTLGTLRAYFDEFLEIEGAFVELRDAEELEALAHETGIAVPEVRHCLERLRTRSAAEYEALSVKLELDLVEAGTAEEYRRARDLTRHAYEKLVRDALDFMRACVTATLEFALKGARS